MTQPCPIVIDTRLVLAKTEATPGTPETLTKIDALPVTGVQITTEAEEVDRSDVYTPTGGGKGKLTTGRRWQFTITQEVYGDDTPHRVFLEACPLTRVTSGTNVVTIYEPSTDICANSGVKPCTVEIHEVGGNKYLASGCVGIVQITGDPGKRMKFQFTMTGEFHPVTDHTTLTGTIPAIPLPLLYKNSDVTFTPDGGSATNLTSCPSFTFTTGQSSIKIPSACTPDGGGFTYVTNSDPASLQFDSVLADKDSNEIVWQTAVSGVDCAVVAITNQSAGGESFRINFGAATLSDPEMGETEGMVAHTLTWSGGPYSFGWFDTTP